MPPSDAPPLANAARGEIIAKLGGRDTRLCVTLSALASLEVYFGVADFEALGERLKHLGAVDLQVVLRALSMDDLPEQIGFAEAIQAVVRAFAAMNGTGNG